MHKLKNEKKETKKKRADKSIKCQLINEKGVLGNRRFPETGVVASYCFFLSFDVQGSSTVRF